VSIITSLCKRTPSYERRASSLAVAGIRVAPGLLRLSETAILSISRCFNKFPHSDHRLLCSSHSGVTCAYLADAKQRAFSPHRHRGQTERVNGGPFN
jgi:hypothetical protein